MNGLEGFDGLRGFSRTWVARGGYARPPVSDGPLRIGIIGLGRMGRFHAAALAGVTEVDVVALAEPSRRRAGRWPRTLLPRPRGTRASPSALAHPGLEAVLVAAPTPTHPELVDAALDAGLHVLCEKPLALDVAESAASASWRADRHLRPAGRLLAPLRAAVAGGQGAHRRR